MNSIPGDLDLIKIIIIIIIIMIIVIIIINLYSTIMIIIRR